eukprot:403356147
MTQRYQIQVLDDYAEKFLLQQQKLEKYKGEYNNITQMQSKRQQTTQKKPQEENNFFNIFSSHHNLAKSGDEPDSYNSNKSLQILDEKYKDISDLKSVYLWGDPGCGKTFIMDLFFETLNIDAKRKLHYNEFMLEIHKQEHKLNKELKGQSTDTIHKVGKVFCQDIIFFCIDEFQVLDIADAMILKRLFESFWEQKLLVLFTSNRPPEDLYLNGLQRFLFMPFIDLLNEKSHVINLSSIDYRLLNAMKMDSYYHPTGKDTDIKLEQLWNSLTNNKPGTPKAIEVAQGRKLYLPREHNKVAEIDFYEMCDQPKGSTDFMALAQQCNTVFIRNVPQLSMERRDILRRFILLIDQLYYFQRKVIIEAEKPLEEIFERPKQKTGFDEEFAIDRIISRLKEMQTLEYQEKAIMKDKT